MWIDYIYQTRKEGGRGLLNVEDTVNVARIGLLTYVDNSEGAANKPLLIVQVQRLSENISCGKRMNKSRTGKVNLYMGNS